MIDEINRHQPRHILTLEDPIEFLHRSRRSLIQQREIGRDSHSFDAALRAALREDPDVILLGELRDVATIRLALTAAETGHLVLATLHTRSAPQAVERLVDVFPAEEKPYVRAQLAGSLQAVIAQKLMRRPGGGRVAIFEVLTATAAVSNLIREGKTHQLASVLQTGAQSGMQTFEQGLQQRIDAGVLGIVLAKGRGLTQLPFEPAFEDHHRRGGIHAAFVERAEAAAVEQVGSRFHGAQALVMQIDLDAEAAVQAVGELARTGGHRLLGAVHVQRQTDHHQIRLPLFQQLFDFQPVRRAVLRFEGRQGAGAAGQLGRRPRRCFWCRSRRR